MKILLIGPQGSGKGTIGKKLSEYFNIPLISTGQVLRDLPLTHPRKKEIEETMEKGELVSQDIVAQLLKEETSKRSAMNGFIFDGWGRTMTDLYYYDPVFDKVVYLDIPEDISINRLLSRRTCDSCGAVFNIISIPPKVSNVCDFCGGKLIQREDDTEDAIKKRLDIFNTETKETIEHFKEEGKLVKIDGKGTPEEVFELVKKALE